MDETYRMLGREHEAELEREADRRRLAAQLPRNGRVREGSVSRLRQLLLQLRRTSPAPAPHARRG
jgi:hypothetical protein